jgi:hypothetical protein
MELSNLDFSFNMAGVDRRALLAEAASELDALKATLGTPGTAIPETEVGALVRSIIDDRAEFGEAPTVYKITDQDFIKSRSGLPFNYKQLMEKHNFYWVRIPVYLESRRNWAFYRLEVSLQFSSSNTDPLTQPIVYDIFPATRFAPLFEAGASFKIGLGENLSLSAGIEPIATIPGAVPGSIGGKVKFEEDIHAGLTVGPLYHRVRKVLIYHTPTSTSKVFWRIEDIDFFENDDPRLIVIVKIPRETREARITARMQAARKFSFASAGLREAIQYLPAAIQVFFRGGAPIDAQAGWDISSLL